MSDAENKSSDFETLKDIFNRQGSSLLIECIADQVKHSANKLNLKPQ